ncbi:MAG: nickel-responsive transcriptional regulator NikR [Candidatus Omnitrophota bacterium]
MLKRFSVSIKKEVSDRFDEFVKKSKFSNRSQALNYLIGQELVNLQWQENKEVAGALIMVYDHHKRDLVQQLLGIQHDFVKDIISSQHIHLDHDNCLEVVVVKGKAGRAKELLNEVKAVKGLKHVALTATTVGV